MAAPLRAYAVGDGECACLVFAHSARDARRLGWRAWYYDAEWLDMRAKLLGGSEYAHLAALARSAEPHAITEGLPACPACGRWDRYKPGEPCAACAEEAEEVN